jgi:hypothetical protein
MFRPPEHGPPQGRNMGPPSTSVQPNKPDNIPKIQKKATVTKDSEASKNSKFPKEPKTQNRAHTSLMSNRLSASRSPKSRTASQEHGFFGVPKTQYHAGLTISAPAVKALGTEQNHTDPKKPGSLSKLLKRGVNKEDPNSEHASHNHSAHNHAGKGQSGHKHSGKSHPPKGHKDHSHSAKSPTLKSHARHARSHSNHSHGKHGNDKHSHKHRPGSSSSSSSASTSNASTKSGSSGSSQSSSAEEEPGRFRKFFGFGSKRNDTGSVNSSGSEESDYEEHGVNPNENMMSGGFHGGSNCKADTRPENSSKVRGKQARSSYDSGSGSASDDNSSISNVSMISGDGMNSGLDDVDYD